MSFFPLRFFLIKQMKAWRASIHLCKHQGKHVEEIMVKTLADKDEQLGKENRLFHELVKTEQILHVRVLLNGLNGLLVTQILHMLHYQGTYHHADRLVARAAMTVLQVLVIFLLNPVPWKAVCKFALAVQLAQS